MVLASQADRGCSDGCYGLFTNTPYLLLQASSRCGTPDELKAMIDEAHHLGLTVRT